MDRDVKNRLSIFNEKVTGLRNGVKARQVPKLEDCGDCDSNPKKLLTKNDGSPKLDQVTSLFLIVVKMLNRSSNLAGALGVWLVRTLGLRCAWIL